MNEENTALTESKQEEPPHEIYNLISNKSELLRQKIETFDFEDPPIDPIYLGNSLLATMRLHEGMGLSANQCGLPYRVFVMRNESDPIIFNPKIVDISDEDILLDEGCLSYPFLFIPIKRPKTIKVRFANVLGDIKTQKYTGITARCFLHEFDHLEGINFMNRASKFHIRRAKKNQEKIKRRMKPAKKQFSAI
jgi:peptide deformylase